MSDWLFERKITTARIRNHIFGRKLGLNGSELHREEFLAECAMFAEFKKGQ